MKDRPGEQPPPPADAELIAAANAGQVEAFEALYYRYRDFVVRLAHRFTGNAEDAVDVLQETFGYLLRKFPGFRLTAAMTTFLYPVVRNLSLAALRKRGRAVSDDDVLAQAPSPQAADPDSQRADLAAALACLPPAQREVVLMRFVDDLSLDEIAAALAIPLGTVKSRLHNALALLRHDARTAEYFRDR